MKVIYMILGLLSFLLGIIGIVLPVLPTTPFLLLAGFFLAKSSDRVNNWFINTKVYKRYIKDFAENKSMKRIHKWTLLIFVDIMMIISFLMIDIVLVKVFIVVLVVSKNYYFAVYIESK